MNKNLFSGKAYVAFLDILGFKDFVQKNNLEVIAGLLCDIEEQLRLHEFGINYAVNKGDKKSKYYLHNLCVIQTKIISMSDSIVVIVPNLNKYALAAMIHICNYIQGELFRIEEEPILLRGAITLGEIYTNGNIVCGKSLVDAYNAEELLSIYPRIILSEDVFWSGEHRIIAEDLFLINKDADDFYYINAFYSIINDKVIKNRLRDKEEKYIGGYFDNRIREKYMWLRKKLDELEIMEGFIYDEKNYKEFYSAYENNLYFRKMA